MKGLLSACMFLVLVACSTSPRPGTDAEVAALAAQIRSLSPTVDPMEARRAASAAYAATYALAESYQITDPPLIHNAKVNAGQRPRGLCYHWAEDMEDWLNDQEFQTLEIARAIANADRPLLIEHSTAVIKARGAAMEEGIVLDPWRKGGTLFWSPVGSDRRYTWLPREEVLRAKGQIIYTHRTEGSVAPAPRP